MVGRGDREVYEDDNGIMPCPFQQECALYKKYGYRQCFANCGKEVGDEND